MKITSQIEEARKLQAEAVERMEEWDAKLQALPDDADEEEIRFTTDCFEKAKREAERHAETMERLISIAEARQLLPVQPDSDDDGDEPEGRKDPARPKRRQDGQLTYRQGGQHSFFRDMIMATKAGDAEAQKRLHEHQHEMRVEQRDVTTGDPGAAGFIPPLYLSDRWVELARPKRPFADAVPKVPLSGDGMRMDFPRVQTGTAVAVQASENASVQETDIDTETYSVDIRTIAGQNDISLQAFERSRPGFDEVVFRDLLRAYDGLLDTQLISGSGSSGQHRGLRNVSGISTITWTDASPTGLEFLAQLYNAAQTVATTLFDEATVVVLHPRRSAWLAKEASSSFPILHQGQLGTVQSGQQDNMFAGNIAGLNVINDPNIATNLGTNTNEDEAYVIALDELMLAEGDVRTRVLEDVGSGTLTVRLQLYAYSAAALGRQPKAIARITGPALVGPTFYTT